MSDTINLANSIWPNGMIVDSDGYAVFNDLGTDKIPVPTNTSDWPEGDELISPFVYKNKTLVGFVDTKAMTVDNPTAITLDYNRIEADFSSIEEGMLTITAPNATTTKYVWANSSSSDTGNSGDTVTFKYKGCKTVDDVIGIEPNFETVDVVDGAWTQSLADLEDGNSMFYDCLALETFESDLSSLTNGSNMFHLCTNLTSFNADVSNLTNGNDMFHSCDNLTTFNSDLSSLTKGSGMFSYCNNLTTFTSSLSSLTDGTYMFSNCKLNTASIKNIAETIATHDSSGYKIYIGIGNIEPTPEEHTYLTQIYEKGWDVYVNGSLYWAAEPELPPLPEYPPLPTSTLDETGETQEVPIPFWAKPVPATEETAEYVDNEGNYYNILGGQFIYVSDPETYGMFLNEEDAAANMRLTKLSK